MRLSLRVATWPSAYIVEPNRAISDAQENIDGDGRSATSTPTKPTATAIQRKRSTRSPSNGADSAMTISGAAI